MQIVRVPLYAAAVLFLFFLQAVVAWQQAIDSPPLQDSAYNSKAFLVSPAQAANLSSLLTEHRVVRLAPFDYSRPHGPLAPNLTLTSGMRLYGLPGTILPTIIVAPGTTNASISNVRVFGLLYFPPTPKYSPNTPTRNLTTAFVSFFSMSGCHVLFDGARVSDLLFVGLTELRLNGGGTRNEILPRKIGGVHVARGSSVTNCKFVRLMVHASIPTFTIDLAEDGDGSFAGNTILWENSLGAMQATYAVVGAEEFTALGSDVESYGACFDEQ